MSTAADELKLIQPKYHNDLKTMAYRNERISSGEPRLVGGYSSVDVTFYTYDDIKMERMEYRAGPYSDEFKELSELASKLFPGVKWRLFSGTANHIEAEITNSRQVYEAMKKGLHYDFEYLQIRLIKVGETARCDGCYQEIYGNRYKCTECADFDLCGSFEIRGMHPFHKLIKI